MKLIGNRDRDVRLEEDLCIHIFTASAAMVGVCLTVIGLIRVVLSFHGGRTIADDILALDALLFLLSCLLSYFSLRTRSTRRMYIVERLADGIFLTGLVLMAFVCGLIVFEMVWVAQQTALAGGYACFPTPA